MSEKTREELLQLLTKCSPRTRKTFMRTIEGKVADDNVAVIKETLDFMQPDLTVRSVEFISSRTCSHGHLLDDKTRIVAVAECCSAITCSVEGCSLNCNRCSKSLCRRHAHTLGDLTYCAACMPGAVLRYLFFGSSKKEVKE